MVRDNLTNQIAVHQCTSRVLLYLICLESFLSNSLIYLIRFGYPVSISIDFDDFSSPFTPEVFVSIENGEGKSNTRDSVYQHSSQFFNIPMKHHLPCLIYNSIALTECLIYASVPHLTNRRFTRFSRLVLSSSSMTLRRQQRMINVRVKNWKRCQYVPRTCKQHVLQFLVP